VPLLLPTRMRMGVTRLVCGMPVCCFPGWHEQDSIVSNASLGSTPVTGEKQGRTALR